MRPKMSTGELPVFTEDQQKELEKEYGDTLSYLKPDLIVFDDGNKINASSTIKKHLLALANQQEENDD